MIKKIVKRTTFSKEQKVDMASIPQLIAKQDWKTLRYFLTAFRDEVSQFLSKPESQMTVEHGNETVMHLCCRYHPPLDVVQGLYYCNPKSVFQADDYGRFPIHTACRSGANVFVIGYLIKVSTDLVVSAQDKSGKTPLHLACEHFLRLYDPLLSGSGRIPSDDALLEIIKMLSGKVPDIVNVEDDEEQTALEIAIEFGASLKVVKKLQKLCERDWKARRFVEPSHDAMRSQFYSQVDSKRKILEQDDLLIPLGLALEKVELSNHDSDEKKPDTNTYRPVRGTTVLPVRRRKPLLTRANAA